MPASKTAAARARTEPNPPAPEPAPDQAPEQPEAGPDDIQKAQQIAAAAMTADSMEGARDNAVAKARELGFTDEQVEALSDQFASKVIGKLDERGAFDTVPDMVVPPPQPSAPAPPADVTSPAAPSPTGTPPGADPQPTAPKKRTFAHRFMGIDG